MSEGTKGEVTLPISRIDPLDLFLREELFKAEGEHAGDEVTMRVLMAIPGGPLCVEVKRGFGKITYQIQLRDLVNAVLNYDLEREGE